MDIFALTLHCRSEGGNAFLNVFHYQCTIPSDSNAYEEAVALIDAFDTINTGKFLALLSETATLDFYSCKRISTGGGPTSTRNANSMGSTIGAGASSGLGANLAWISASPNNRFARNIIAGLAVGSFSGEVWSAAFIQACSDFIGVMKTPLVLAGDKGSATFVQYTKKTKTGTTITDGTLRPKPTMLNKRTLPVP
jgi:hypothetical protein